MNRRNAIKNASLLLGGILSAPTLLAMGRWEKGEIINGVDFSLSDIHRKIVAEIAEMIIPKSDTPGEASPGAKDVGVPAFIEMMLKDCYKAAEHSVFTAGLVALEQDKFLEMDAIAQTEKLKKLEAEAKTNRQGVSFWRLIKELTLLGYFTSEQAVKSSFEYVQIPAKFEVIKLKPNQKAYAY
jgi:Gluconate 2-dehydrogenase subunit 3